MLPVTVMFSVTGADKKRFLDYVAANPSSYKDWGLKWDVEKGGKEDDLFSPYLEKPFDRARAAGVIPPASRASAAPGARSPIRARRPTST